MTQALAVSERAEELTDLKRRLPTMSVEQMFGALRLQIVHATNIENPALFLRFLADYTGLVLLLVERLHEFNKGEFASTNTNLSLVRDYLLTGQESLTTLIRGEAQGLAHQMQGLASQIKSETQKIADQAKTDTQILSNRIDNQVSDINKKLDLLLRQNVARAS